VAVCGPRQLETPNIGSYVFCHSNPVNRVDPDGEFSTKLGAWIYSIFHGGGEIGRDRASGQYYVGKQVPYTGDGFGVEYSRKFSWGDSQNGGSIVTGGNASQGMGGTAKHLDPTIDLSQFPTTLMSTAKSGVKWLYEASQKIAGLMGFIPEAKKSATPKAGGDNGKNKNPFVIVTDTKNDSAFFKDQDGVKHGGEKNPYIQFKSGKRTEKFYRYHKGDTIR
jgi:hypothetical protein